MTTRPPEPLVLEPTDWCVFNSHGRVDKGGDAMQGPVIESKHDFYTTIWTFPSLVIPSGFELQKLELYLYPKHWYYQKGTCKIGIHAQLDIPTTRPKVHDILELRNWPRTVGKWLTIPDKFHEMFLEGTASGIGIGGTQTDSLVEYGRFDPKVRLRATLKEKAVTPPISMRDPAPPSPFLSFSRDPAVEPMTIPVPVALLRYLFGAFGDEITLDYQDVQHLTEGIENFGVEVHRLQDPAMLRFKFVDRRDPS